MTGVPTGQDWVSPQKGHGARGWGTPRKTWDQRLGCPAGKDMGPEAGIVIWGGTWDWGTPPPC